MKTPIESILSSNERGVIYVTGGGSGVLGSLLENGGGSSTLLEGRVPYAAAATTDILGHRPENYSCARTARQLAMSAMHRAVELDPSEPSELFGIGATSSLTKGEGERKGRRNHAYVAIQTYHMTRVFSLELSTREDELASGVSNGNLTVLRKAQETVVEMAIIKLMKEFMGNPVDEHPFGHGVKEVTDVRGHAQDGKEASLLFNPQGFDYVRYRPKHYMKEEGKPSVVFPGSFNPLHRGHKRIIRYADQAQWMPEGEQTALEISVTNVDKPPLDYIDLSRLHDQLQDEEYPYYLTDAPTFLEKSRIFPQSTFLTGYDTYRRLTSEEYYEGTNGMNKSLGRIYDRGCGFMVFPRTIDGQFSVPVRSEMMTHMPGFVRRVVDRSFDDDISSTQIRESRD